MKKAKILNAGINNEALNNETDFFLTKNEQRKIIGGNLQADVTCKKGYRDTGGGSRCRCGYTA
jgi:hypothetical protein